MEEGAEAHHHHCEKYSLHNLVISFLSVSSYESYPGASLSSTFDSSSQFHLEMHHIVCSVCRKELCRVAFGGTMILFSSVLCCHCWMEEMHARFV